MTTITPKPPAEEPDPDTGGGTSGTNEWVELVKWLLSDDRRAAWAFLTLVAVLVAGVLTTALLAPHIGDLGSVVGGGVVGGGLGLGSGALAQRHRRGRRRRSE